jgi:hypothetical protein
MGIAAEITIQHGLIQYSLLKGRDQHLNSTCVIHRLTLTNYGGTQRWGAA